MHIPGTMQNRTCSYSMLKLVSFQIQAHWNAFLQILQYFSQIVKVDGLNVYAYSFFQLFDCAGCSFVHFVWVVVLYTLYGVQFYTLCVGCSFVHFVWGVVLYTLCGVQFCTLCPSIDPKERYRQALYRLPPVSNFIINFWQQHFDGARLSRNPFPNAVCHVLNEPVCRYLRKRNQRCSTVYIEISLGPLVRDSSCIMTITITIYHTQNSPTLSAETK